MTSPDLSPQQPASLEERVDAALTVCDDLLNVLPQMLTRIEQLEQARPPAPDGERRSDYRFELYPEAQTDQEHAEQVERITAAWSRLTDWVDWLVRTYRLTSTIPPCWPGHPVIVEELVSLRLAWVAAWADNAAPDAPASWQERLFRAKTRLADGNWGQPRCDDHHDDIRPADPERKPFRVSTDVVDLYQSWADAPSRVGALHAARERALDCLQRPAIGQWG